MLFRSGPAGGNEHRPVGLSHRPGGVHVAAPEQVAAARSGVADRQRRAPPELALDVGVEHVDPRIVEIVLHRPHRDRSSAGEVRGREGRVDDHRPRRERRIGDRDDQVLMVVRVEVEPVASAKRGGAVAEDVQIGRASCRERVYDDV